MISKPQAKYFAYELTKTGKDDVLGGLSQALMNSQVDLQPHQVDAAAFALRSPLSHGALLADEVGLGKTIEAGIVLSQFWAEGKRSLLIICPAALRVQWSKELEEKFALPNIVVDGKNFIKNILNLKDKIVIMSYNFAANRESDLQAVPWDLVVMDEAHKLRNVYKKDNVIAKVLKTALQGRKKLLLTATPLQNTLLELYGLSQFIDEQIFADGNSFKMQYGGGKNAEYDDLKDRLKTFCKRTLRRDVLEYIRYTDRKSSTFQFMPTEQEIELHDRVYEFLWAESVYALPMQQRHLIELVLFKLLASSTAAICGTFETILERLENKRAGKNTSDADEKLKELVVEADAAQELLDVDSGVVENEIDQEILENEIEQVKKLIGLCNNITVDRKTDALLDALNTTFNQMAQMDDKNPPLKKALIFTESRRTQEYLFKFLTENGYKDKIVLFHGGNKDNRAELLQQFKDDAEIMIATEAGAEGLNMQFCSVVVNYDMPWNPQRVEQRIGRCHRYGQKHDVIVVNFINSANIADKRIFELLSEKFHLFQGVFGASDEVLGAIEDGVDFERKILQICKTCRNLDDIERAFNELQQEMEQSIAERMNETKLKMLDLLDADVLQKMKINFEQTAQQLSRYQNIFWRLCKYVLKNDGVFDEGEFSFTLTNPALGKCQKYFFITMDNKRTEIPNEQVLRLNHDISQYVLRTAKEQDSDMGQVVFDLSGHATQESQLQDLMRNCAGGWCSCKLLTINSLDREEYLVLTGVDDNGNSVPSEVMAKMFRLNVVSEAKCEKITDELQNVLIKQVDENVGYIVQGAKQRNNNFYKEELLKIDRYTTDKLLPLERQIRENDEKIRMLTADIGLESDVERLNMMQNELSECTKLKHKLRMQLFEAQDELDSRRQELVNGFTKRMRNDEKLTDLFTFRWEVH